MEIVLTMASFNCLLACSVPYSSLILTMSDTDMTKAKDSFYLSIWRQAGLEPVTIPCLSAKEANAIRLKMYVAARPYRNMEPKETRKRDGTKVITPSKASQDPELHHRICCTEIIVQEHDDGSATLLCRPDWMNERLMRISAATGIPFGPQNEALESLKRIQGRLANEGFEDPIELPKLPVAPADYLKLKQQNSQPLAHQETTEPEYVPLGDDYERKALEALEDTGDLYAEE